MKEIIRLAPGIKYKLIFELYFNLEIPLRDITVLKCDDFRLKEGNYLFIGNKMGVPRLYYIPDSIQDLLRKYLNISRRKGNMYLFPGDFFGSHISLAALEYMLIKIMELNISVIKDKNAA